MTRTPWFMWIWPVTIILSSIAAGLVTAVFPGTMLRSALIMWFLFICPGMTVSRFLQLNEAVMQWTLALALSFAIDAFIAGILLYTGWWSPLRILSILIVFCSIGALMQIIFIHPGVTTFTLKR
ncbi:MAG: hypothetical protein ACXVCM_12225, partial [Ktedonobacteraceae bacterium]